MNRRWVSIGALLLLSLLWAVGWVRADLSPGSSAGLHLRPMLGQAVLLGVFAGLAAVGAVVLRRNWLARSTAGWAVLVGVGLFAVPLVLTTLAASWIDDSTRVALFSLTPLFAVVFEPHFALEREQTREVRGSFPAAMVAVAGTLLVFPVELPHSYASAFALIGLVVAAALVAAANCVGVREMGSDQGRVPAFAAVAAGSAACLLALLGLTFQRNEAATAGIGVWAVSDLIALALLFWLMGRMSAVQMTTRFQIAPLIANLISLALLRPHVEVQAWIGLALIAAGSGWMLLAREDGGSDSIGSMFRMK